MSAVALSLLECTNRRTWRFTNRLISRPGGIGALTTLNAHWESVCVRSRCGSRVMYLIKSKQTSNSFGRCSRRESIVSQSACEHRWVKLAPSALYVRSSPICPMRRNAESQEVFPLRMILINRRIPRRQRAVSVRFDQSIIAQVASACRRSPVPAGASPVASAADGTNAAPLPR
jgi:hypothetical protein